MGRPPGKRYLIQPGFGVAHTEREFISQISFKDACVQYMKDEIQDKNQEDESKTNFGIPMLLLGLKNPIGSIIGASTMMGEDLKVLEENINKLSPDQLKETWELLIDHFGLGVIDAPQQVIDQHLRGFHGDPTLLDTNGDGYVDKIVEAEIHGVDGSVTIMTPDTDEPDIIISPVIVHDPPPDANDDNDNDEPDTHKFDFEPDIVTLSDDETEIEFEPEIVTRSDDSGNDEPDDVLDDDSEMEFEPDIVYRSDDPRNVPPTYDNDNDYDDDIDYDDDPGDDYDDVPPAGQP